MKIKFWSKFLMILAILAIVAGPASAQILPPSESTQRPPMKKLSYRLAALAGSASLRATGAAAQANTLSLPERGPGSLMHSGSQILVNVRMWDISDAAIQALSSTGARVTFVSKTYQTAVAYIDPANLQAAASLGNVLSLEEELTPQTGGAGFGAKAKSGAPAPAASCPQGMSVSEGDVQLKADQARSTYSLNGSGVKVGILSDSYNTYTFGGTTAANDILSGDLPGASNPCGATTAINVVDDSVPGTDEGRGMLQIVHDIAPQAQLSFATAFTGLLGFADNIRALRKAGAAIIADDVFYLDEPFFQEGPINVAISDVVNGGALYFAPGGNHNLIVDGKDVTSYEAPAYRPTTCPAALKSSLADCHNFATSGPADSMESITLDADGSIIVDFQWAEPWEGVSSDLNIYLLNNTGAVVRQSSDDNTISQKPFELFSYTNSSGSTATYSLVIGRLFGAMPRLKYIFIQGTKGISALEYNTSTGGDIVGPSVYGHSASTKGITVGAIPFNNNNAPETFSSRGPSTIYFGPAANASPAAPITPVTLNQPDIVATDGGCTTFFGSYDFATPCYRFYGTSAAAPHAAAVAALVLQRSRTLFIPMNQSQMKLILQSSAQTVSGGTTASVGAGMVDALAAAAKLDSLPPTNTPTPTRTPTPTITPTPTRTPTPTIPPQPNHLFLPITLH
jgi:hypothetical protein